MVNSSACFGFHQSLSKFVEDAAIDEHIYWRWIESIPVRILAYRCSVCLAHTVFSHLQVAQHGFKHNLIHSDAWDILKDSKLHPFCAVVSKGSRRGFAQVVLCFANSSCILILGRTPTQPHFGRRPSMSRTWKRRSWTWRFKTDKMWSFLNVALTAERVLGCP